MKMNRIRTFFGGKVKIETLSSIVPLPGQVVNAKGPKRIFLEKGELAEVYNLQAGVRHIAYVEFLKGKARGGHYHTRQEYFYIIRGKMELEAVDIATEVRQKTTVKEGDLIFISPKVSHTLTAVKSGHAIEFSKVCFRPDDTVKYTYDKRR